MSVRSVSIFVFILTVCGLFIVLSFSTVTPTHAQNPVDCTDKASWVTYIPMQPGHRDARVLCLQQYLNKLGYRVAQSHIPETDTVTPGTLAALSRFQLGRGLADTGFLDPDTLQEIRKTHSLAAPGGFNAEIRNSDEYPNHNVVAIGWSNPLVEDELGVTVNADVDHYILETYDNDNCNGTPKEDTITESTLTSAKPLTSIIILSPVLYPIPEAVEPQQKSYRVYAVSNGRAGEKNDCFSLTLPKYTPTTTQDTDTESQDTTPPVITLITSNPPAFTIHSTEAGTLTDDCTTAPATAISAGNSDLNFTSLPDGTHTCTISITDAAENTGTLTLSEFTVLPAPTNPSYTFTDTENGTKVLARLTWDPVSDTQSYTGALYASSTCTGTNTPFPEQGKTLTDTAFVFRHTKRPTQVIRSFNVRAHVNGQAGPLSDCVSYTVPAATDSQDIIPPDIEPAELANQVYRKYKTLFSRPDIAAGLLEVLDSLKSNQIQKILSRDPRIITTVVDRPAVIRTLGLELREEGVALLENDQAVRDMLRDDLVQSLIMNTDAIDALAALVAQDAAANAAELANQVYQKYKNLFNRADIAAGLPEVLDSLKSNQVQKILSKDPTIIDTVIANIDVLATLNLDVNPEGVALLENDQAVRDMLRDDLVQSLIMNTDAIDALAALVAQDAAANAAELANQVYQKYKNLFNRADIAAGLPEVLDSLKSNQVQKILSKDPTIIDTVIANIDVLATLNLDVNPEGVALLENDQAVRDMLRDDLVQSLIMNTDAIDALAALTASTRLANQVYQKYRDLLTGRTILATLEGVKSDRIQNILSANPAVIDAVIADPDILEDFGVQLSPEGIALLKDEVIKDMLGDPLVQSLLADVDAIDALAALVARDIASSDVLSPDIDPDQFAKQVYRKYEDLLSREDVKAVLLQAFEDLQSDQFQVFRTSSKTIDAVIVNPYVLEGRVDPEFIELLANNQEVRDMFSDPLVRDLLADTELLEAFRLFLEASLALLVDLDSPAVSISPADGTTVTDADTDIVLTFSEPIHRNSTDSPFKGDHTIKRIIILQPAIGYVAEVDGSKVIIDPDDPLPGGDITVSVSDAYYDAAGNQGVPATATFTVDTTSVAVADTVPPTVSISPADGATVTDADTNIVLTFSEPIRRNGTDSPFNNNTIKNIITLQPDMRYEAEINDSKDTVTIDPRDPLPADAVSVAISDDYYDEVGNRGAPVSVTFTVGTASPKAVTISTYETDDVYEEDGQQGVGVKMSANSVSSDDHALFEEGDLIGIELYRDVGDCSKDVSHLGADRTQKEIEKSPRDISVDAEDSLAGTLSRIGDNIQGAHYSIHVGSGNNVVRSNCFPAPGIGEEVTTDFDTLFAGVTSATGTTSPTLATSISDVASTLESVTVTTVKSSEALDGYGGYELRLSWDSPITLTDSRLTLSALYTSDQCTGNIAGGGIHSGGDNDGADWFSVQQDGSPGSIYSAVDSAYSLFTQSYGYARVQQTTIGDPGSVYYQVAFDLKGEDDVFSNCFKAPAYGETSTIDLSGLFSSVADTSPPTPGVVIISTYERDDTIYEGGEKGVGVKIFAASVSPDDYSFLQEGSAIDIYLYRGLGMCHRDEFKLSNGNSHGRIKAGLDASATAYNARNYGVAKVRRGIIQGAYYSIHVRNGNDVVRSGCFQVPGIGESTTTDFDTLFAGVADTPDTTPPTTVAGITPTTVEVTQSGTGYTYTFTWAQAAPYSVQLGSGPDNCQDGPGFSYGSSSHRSISDTSGTLYRSYFVSLVGSDLQTDCLPLPAPGDTIAPMSATASALQSVTVTTEESSTALDGYGGYELKLFWDSPLTLTDSALRLSPLYTNDQCDRDEGLYPGGGSKTTEWFSVQEDGSPGTRYSDDDTSSLFIQSYGYARVQQDQITDSDSDSVYYTVRFTSSRSGVRDVVSDCFKAPAYGETSTIDLSGLVSSAADTAPPTGDTIAPVSATASALQSVTVSTEEESAALDGYEGYELRLSWDSPITLTDSRLRLSHMYVDDQCAGDIHSGGNDAAADWFSVQQDGSPGTTFSSSDSFSIFDQSYGYARVQQGQIDNPDSVYYFVALEFQDGTPFVYSDCLKAPAYGETSTIDLSGLVSSAADTAPPTGDTIAPVSATASALQSVTVSTEEESAALDGYEGYELRLSWSSPVTLVDSRLRLSALYMNDQCDRDGGLHPGGGYETTEWFSVRQDGSPGTTFSSSDSFSIFDQSYGYALVQQGQIGDPGSVYYRVIFDSKGKNSVVSDCFKAPLYGETSTIDLSDLVSSVVDESQSAASSEEVTIVTYERSVMYEGENGVGVSMFAASVAPGDHPFLQEGSLIALDLYQDVDMCNEDGSKLVTGGTYDKVEKDPVDIYVNAENESGVGPAIVRNNIQDAYYSIRVESGPDTARSICLPVPGIRQEVATDFDTLFEGATLITRPTVVSISPADGATGIDADTNIVLTFSEPIYRSSSKAPFKNNSIKNIITFSPKMWYTTTIDDSKTVVTIDPRDSLTGTVSVSVSNGYYDEEGHPGVPLEDASFTIARTVVPSASATTSALQFVTVTTEESSTALDGYAGYELRLFWDSPITLTDSILRLSPLYMSSQCTGDIHPGGGDSGADWFSVQQDGSPGTRLSDGGTSSLFNRSYGYARVQQGQIDNPDSVYYQVQLAFNDGTLTRYSDCFKAPPYDEKDYAIDLSGLFSSGVKAALGQPDRGRYLTTGRGNNMEVTVTVRQEAAPLLNPAAVRKYEVLLSTASYPASNPFSLKDGDEVAINVYSTKDSCDSHNSSELIETAGKYYEHPFYSSSEFLSAVDRRAGDRIKEHIKTAHYLLVVTKPGGGRALRSNCFPVPQLGEEVVTDFGVLSVGLHCALVSDDDGYEKRCLDRHGNINLDDVISADGLQFPEIVRGDLRLDRLTTAEGLVLPNTITGDLYLRGLTSAKGLTFPKVIGGDLHLQGLTTAKDLVLPLEIGGNLQLTGLTSAKGLVLPRRIGGLLFRGLKSMEGLNLSGKLINKSLSIADAVSVAGLDLSNTVIKGDLRLAGVTSVNGLDLSKTKVGGSWLLTSLVSAVDLTFPREVEGSLDLRVLTTVRGVTLPKEVGGDLFLNGLTSTTGITLPTRTIIEGDLHLSGITSAAALVLPEHLRINGDLYVTGLTEEAFKASGVLLEGYKVVGEKVHLSGGVSKSKREIELSIPKELPPKTITTEFVEGDQYPYRYRFEWDKDFVSQKHRFLYFYSEDSCGGAVHISDSNRAASYTFTFEEIQRSYRIYLKDGPSKSSDKVSATRCLPIKQSALQKFVIAPVVTVVCSIPLVNNLCPDQDPSPVTDTSLSAATVSVDSNNDRTLLFTLSSPISVDSSRSHYLYGEVFRDRFCSSQITLSSLDSTAGDFSTQAPITTLSFSYTDLLNDKAFNSIARFKIAWFRDGNPLAESRCLPIPTLLVDTVSPTVSISPVDSVTVTDADTNIVLTFSEPIRQNDTDVPFEDGDAVKRIITLQYSGTDIPYSATLRDDRLVTIDPTYSLPSGVISVAVNNNYYDAAGNRGTSADVSFTVDVDF